MVAWPSGDVQARIIPRQFGTLVPLCYRGADLTLRAMRATIHNINATKAAVDILDSAIRRLRANRFHIDLDTVEHFQALRNKRLADLRSVGVFY